MFDNDVFNVDKQARTVSLVDPARMAQLRAQRLPFINRFAAPAGAPAGPSPSASPGTSPVSVLCLCRALWVTVTLSRISSSLASPGRGLRSSPPSAVAGTNQRRVLGRECMSLFFWSARFSRA